MKNFILLLLLFLLPGIALFFTGCIPSKPTEEVEILPSERLIKKLEVNRRKIKTFEGTGVLSIKTPDMNNSANFKVVLLKPDTVYFEIYGPFGIDLAQALITNNNFSFYDIIHNTLYQGKTNSDALNKIFKINITFNDLIDAFIGSVNLTQKLSREPDKYEVIYNKYILSYSDPSTDTQTKYSVDVRELALTNYQILNSGEKVLVDGTYSKFKLMENIPVPYLTEFKNESANQSIRIEYKKINLNEQGQHIGITIPDDAEIFKL